MTNKQFQQHILPLKNKMFRFALSYVHNAADAQDIVQEVMLSVWERIKDPQSINNLEAWCMRITRNKALNMLKKKGRQYLPIMEQVHLSSQEANPLKQTEEKEAVNRVQDMIRSLPEKQRAVILLRDVEGYSFQEVADILQLETNHIRVLLFRARKQVKEALIRVMNYGISRTK